MHLKFFTRNVHLYQAPRIEKNPEWLARHLFGRATLTNLSNCESSDMSRRSHNLLCFCVGGIEEYAGLLITFHIPIFGYL